MTESNLRNPYLTNVPDIGNLYHEKTLMIVDPNMFFSVLSDVDGNLYGCISYFTETIEEHLASPISDDDLLKIIRNEVSVTDGLGVATIRAIGVNEFGYEKSEIHSDKRYDIEFPRKCVFWEDPVNSERWLSEFRSEHPKG